jgi:hypothetical protein
VEQPSQAVLGQARGPSPHSLIFTWSQTAQALSKVLYSGDRRIVSSPPLNYPLRKYIFEIKIRKLNKFL